MYRYIMARLRMRAIDIDFGTNAEMALKLDSRILVGSAAAGPAIEGQHISRGMLAAPGAISDLEYDWGWIDMESAA